MKKPFWKRGEQIAFARAAGVSRSYFSHVINRRKQLSLKRSFYFEYLSKEVIGRKIPWRAWVMSKKTKHPAFKGGAK